ncbi:hypothetical protein SUGI_0490940 [Cryptomeria japonica]|nr:hypothetical protein SUGI_0490940 [Cryptomeria japonica]
MCIPKKKFENLLKDSTTRVFTRDISHGFTWSKRTREKNPFEIGLTNFIAELEENRKRVDIAIPAVPIVVIAPEISMAEATMFPDAIQVHSNGGKIQKWMEGPRGRIA